MWLVIEFQLLPFDASSMCALNGGVCFHVETRSVVSCLKGIQSGVGCQPKLAVCHQRTHVYLRARILKATVRRSQAKRRPVSVFFRWEFLRLPNPPTVLFHFVCVKGGLIARDWC